MIIEKAVDTYNNVDNINAYHGIYKDGYSDVEAVQNLCGEPIAFWKKVKLFFWFTLPSIAYLFLFEYLSKLIDPILQIGFEGLRLPECFYPIYALILGVLAITGPAKDFICLIFNRW